MLTLLLDIAFSLAFVALVAQFTPVLALLAHLPTGVIRCAGSGLSGLPRAIGRGLVHPTRETAKAALLIAAVISFCVATATHEPAPGDSRLVQWLTHR